MTDRQINGQINRTSTYRLDPRKGSSKNHLIEKLDRDALPLLAKEEDGLGGEDEVLQGDALFCLLHRHNPPTIPDCEWCKRTKERSGAIVKINFVFVQDLRFSSSS